ncbi:27845_t:CDS:2, partial [Racocetra persica]
HEALRKMHEEKTGKKDKFGFAKEALAAFAAAEAEKLIETK